MTLECQYASLTFGLVAVSFEVAVRTTIYPSGSLMEWSRIKCTLITILYIAPSQDCENKWYNWRNRSFVEIDSEYRAAFVYLYLARTRLFQSTHEKIIEDNHNENENFNDIHTCASSVGEPTFPEVCIISPANMTIAYRDFKIQDEVLPWWCINARIWKPHMTRERYKVKKTRKAYNGIYNKEYSSL